MAGGAPRDDLASLVAGLPRSDVALLVGLALARLAEDGGAPVPTLPVEEDRLLTVDQAAKRLGSTPDWVRRHGREKGLVVELSPGQVRCSNLAISRLIAARRHRGAQ